MKTKIASVLLPLCAALFLAGCPCKAPAPDSADAPSAVTSKPVIGGLAGQSWKLDKWTSPDGSTQEPGAIDITFAEENRIAGFSGVNRYMGGVAFTDAGDIDLSKGLASTMMAGPPDAMAREHRYLQDLAKARHARLDQDRLIFTGADSLRLEFVPKK